MNDELKSLLETLLWFNWPFHFWGKTEWQVIIESNRINVYNHRSDNELAGEIFLSDVFLLLLI